MRRKKKQPNKPAKVLSNKLRIIGGEWRGRKLQFVNQEGLRPTPDRIRETLFNWLQGQVYGTHCLDLFAGSGALGLEALSRGACNVVFVEKAKPAAAQIESNLSLLKANAKVVNNDAVSYLKNTDQQFDIIFLDPPFRHNLLPEILEIILKKNLLSEDGLIYLEHEAEELFNWQENYSLALLKETKAGQVKSYLLKPLHKSIAPDKHLTST